MPDEKAICNVCGKKVDLTMSFSITGGEPTPPICKKCFKETTDTTIKQLKEGQKMPRGLTAVKDIEKATAPEEEIEYWDADAVKEIATKLIKENEVQFGHLKNFKIAYIFKKEMTGDAKGKATVISEINRFLSGYDAHIVICYEIWKKLTEKQRQAITAHEMTHLGENDEGDKLKIIDHDIQEFSSIVATFGPWTPALEKFSEQLDLFDKKGK